MAASTEALIIEYDFAPIRSSPPPSPLSPLSSLLPYIPSPPLLLPSPPLFLPSTTHRTDIPEAKMPPQKRACFTALAPRFEVRECSTTATARQTRLDFTCGTNYGFIDTLDASIMDAEERAPTTLEEVDERATDLINTLRQETKETYVRHEDAQDDRALLRAQINTLRRDRSMALEALIRAQKACITTLEAQVGPIPGMTPAEGLTAIQAMADHSQKWHDGSPSRSISGSNNSEGMASIASKLDNLG
nr:hypothetical protein [Tanacetum cinerariifolium]